MFLIIAAVLVVMWVTGFLMFHVAGGLIHILILFAIISAVLHMFRGRSASV